MILHSSKDHKSKKIIKEPQCPLTKSHWPEPNVIGSRLQSCN